MTPTEQIKSRVYELVSKLSDEAALARLQSMVADLVLQQEDADSLHTLTEAERKRVLDAYEESLNPDNLLSHQFVKARFAKWLST